MTRSVDTQYAIGRKINKKLMNPDTKPISFEGNSYQLIEQNMTLNQAIDAVVGCSYCSILELLVTKEVRILSIVNRDE